MRTLFRRFDKAILALAAPVLIALFVFEAGAVVRLSILAVTAVLIGVQFSAERLVVGDRPFE